MLLALWILFLVFITASLTQIVVSNDDPPKELPNIKFVWSRGLFITDILLDQTDTMFFARVLMSRCI